MDYFSPNYQTARQRFLTAARHLNADVESFGLEERGAENEALYIDVARIGTHARRVILSSGLHGVEGFFGSAVQLAWMESERRTNGLQHEVSYVLVHALNPYGFSWRRRTNEDNIDLNRNFLLPEQHYAGAPDGYVSFDSFLNPTSPPPRWDPYSLRAAYYVMRHGMETMKNVVAVGQYAFPKGLFFGGHGPAASTRIVQSQSTDWFRGAERIIHVDLHSGLGPMGHCTLLLMESGQDAAIPFYHQHFTGQHLESMLTPNGTAYPACGLMGQWLQQHATCDYRMVGSEFGTYSGPRVLGALRAENRVHHYCQSNDARWESAKQKLVECFCPARTGWRHTVVARGLHTVHQATAAAAA